ncbi:MAG: RNA methyltransferase [Alysiella sp.]|uniref:TrmH family RNA methyltransferase n=1 Tax=Alysiella sp. TaxID=1872483 RepID=UPI0026DBF4B8|nr:RNA methyltransferase [Alysiella sp.]MDO4434225.1 RNA methyltransferase [Alysiella sp.]
MTAITSSQNPQIKHLAKLLSNSKYRREQKQAVLEGTHLLVSWLNSGNTPETVFIPQHRLNKPEIQALKHRLPEQICVITADDALNKISSLSNADEITAIIKLPEKHTPFTTGDCVVLDRVQDPGNMGTVLRSATAAGIKQVILGKGCADAWSPKVLRAGMGAHFLLSICERVDLNAWHANYTHAIYATALTGKNPQNLYHLDLRSPAAWLFGNEGSGVATDLIECADSTVHIPMLGQTESLNIAMAATVCLFEQMRQRTHS